MRLLLPACLLLSACAGLPRDSHVLNPAGWPSKGLSFVGRHAADSGWPVVREVGRLFGAVGELADAPAMFVEGLVTADADRLLGSGEHLVVGTGSTLTAAWNVPFFVIPGRNVALARDVELVNEALEYMEGLPPARYRYGPDDPRTFVFPKGTRARASGQNLIYTIPGHGEVIQACEENLAWNALQWTFGTHFPAQERSWGFVVDTREEWNARNPRFRAETILHELYHQHMQMRDWLLGWTTVYWPAYMATFPFTGWHGHWAEMGGPHDAGAVDRALRTWIRRPVRSK